MINLHLQADSVGELHDQMREFLAGTAIGTVTSPPLAPATTTSEAPKRLTAAQKRAEEKAAKDAAEKSGSTVRSEWVGTGAEPEPEKTTEADKQDAKDEAAEQKAPEAEKLTHDHVRKMLGGYVMAYGMEAAQADGPDMLGVQKISELPDDQAKLAAAIVNIAAGIEKNPKKRDMAGDGISAEKVAELKPIVEAAKAVK